MDLHQKKFGVGAGLGWGGGGWHAATVLPKEGKFRGESISVSIQKGAREIKRNKEK